MKNLTAAVFIAVLIPFYSSQAVPAVNTVSGTGSQGASIEIRGTGFGIKSPAAPYIYDNFESGIPGQLLSGGWYLTSANPAKKPKYSTDNPRIAGAKSAYQDFTGGNYNSTIGLVGQNSKTFYVSGWNYTRAWNAPSRNFKPLAFRSGPAGNWDEPEGRLDIYPVNSTGSGHLYTGNCNNITTVNSWGFLDGQAWTYDRWWRMETWISQGNMDQGNGLWQLWEDLRLDKQISGDFITTAGCIGLACRVPQTPVPTPTPNPTPIPATCDCITETCDDYDNFYLSSYFATDQGSPQPQAQIYWDELYVDYTRARIEIGDASTWSACTHREIQIPASWSETQITATVNTGSFPAGSQVYVYVVDANGVANEHGGLLTLGETPVDGIAPAAPAHLRVN